MGHHNPNPSSAHCAVFGLCLCCLLIGRPTAADDSQDELIYHIPFFPSTGDPFRQGFSRIINQSDEGGEVSIEAFDPEGKSYGPVNLTLEANKTRHFNSVDLEDGNEGKGIPVGIKPAVGWTCAGYPHPTCQAPVENWRLLLKSRLELKVLSYSRTPDAFLTSLHDTVPPEPGQAEGEYLYRVMFFNPASNDMSSLVMSNIGDAAADVELIGTDDEGSSGAEPISLSIEPNATRSFGARSLELGNSPDFSGHFGDGRGKWSIDVKSDEPLLVMSLLFGAYLTNMSTAP